MIKFILKSLLLFFIIITPFVILGFIADGYTDTFYLKFTSPKQKSLIIGTSKAGQGIQPEFLNKNLKSTYFKPIYNYGFTILHSPYGETYFNAIKGKVLPNSTDGLFILTVDPWNISSRKDINYEIESKKELAKIHFYNCNPNYDYLFNAYGNTVFDLFTAKKDTIMFLHNDGWLEVNITLTPEQIKEKNVEKKKLYHENSEVYEFSKNRLEWLKKTVRFLQNHGKVVLVRIPVSDFMLEIEQDFFPDFDVLININFTGIKYLNYKYKCDDYTYTDGNHLDKSSGKRFSENLANDINHVFLTEN